MRRRPRPLALLGWTALLAALALAAAGGTDRMNGDAVAYVRLGLLWSQGDFALAASPYWGPLMPVALAPLLRLGVDPILAGRIVMALSGLVFVVGVARLLRAGRVRETPRRLALVVAGLFAVARSAETITPDLGLAGLLALCAAEMISPRWRTRGGMVRAAAYAALAALAKPVGLPTALLLGGGIALLHHAARGIAWRRLGAPVGGTLLVGFVLLLPWAATVVALHGTGGLTVTARVNHAIVGPEEPTAPPEHPGAEGFRKPAPGRKTVWEDPQGVGYGEWSPLDSWGHLGHQLLVIQRNVRRMAQYLLDLDLLALGVFAAVAACALHRPWRETMRRQRWRWSGVLFLAALAVYLPFYSHSSRYYFPAFAFLLPPLFGMADWLGRGPGTGARLRRAAIHAAVLVSVGGPAAAGAWEATVRATPDPAVRGARQVAARLRAAGIDGALAADHPQAIYLALLRDAPWYGWRRTDLTAQALRDSGAEIVVLDRTSELASALAGQPDFESLDARLFAPTDPLPPVRLFRRRPPAAPPARDLGVARAAGRE